MAPTKWSLRDPKFAYYYSIASSHEEEYVAAKLWTSVLNAALDVANTNFMLYPERRKDRPELEHKQSMGFAVRLIDLEADHETTLLHMECASITGTASTEQDAFRRARLYLEEEGLHQIYVLTSIGTKFAAWKVSRPVGDNAWDDRSLQEVLVPGYIDVGGENGELLDPILAAIRAKDSSS